MVDLGSDPSSFLRRDCFGLGSIGLVADLRSFHRTCSVVADLAIAEVVAEVVAVVVLNQKTIDWWMATVATAGCSRSRTRYPLVAVESAVELAEAAGHCLQTAMTVRAAVVGHCLQSSFLRTCSDPVLLVATAGAAGAVVTIA
jgi:hypothetical protein